MRVIEPGHAYALDAYDGDANMVPRHLRFTKRVGLGNEPSAVPGTNCQEVLRVLIDRVKYRNGQEADSRNATIVNYLRGALWELELRHADRYRRLEAVIARGKEFSLNTTSGGDRPLCVEMIPACSRCGYVFCEEHVDGR